MSESPVPDRADANPTDAAESKPTDAVLATYNLVTDTVTGVNVRWSDNKFQAMFVLVAVALAALVGSLVALVNEDWQLPWYGGAMVGAFAGLVIGIFASGIFLMIFRARRHIQGKHD